MRVRSFTSRPAIVLLAAALIVGGGLLAARRRDPPPARAEGPPLVSVTSAAAERRDVPVYVRALGTVQAFNTVNVKSRVDGQITKVLFTEGQEVKAGDPLFEIDPRPFRAALDNAEALRQRDAAQLEGAELDLQRYGALLPSGWQTRQSYDDQQATVGQLRATVKVDQARIDTAKLNLDYTSIRAPLNGRTGARLVDIGNLVQAAQGTPLVTIAQVQPIFVSFNVPQDFLDRIRDAQAAQPLRVLAYSNDDSTMLAEGELSLINNQVDASTGTVVMKASFENTDERLWPGELVSARLIMSMHENALTVPAQAVMEGANGAYVYVIKPDGTVAHRDVVVAQTEAGAAVIERGLSDGDPVVVDGQTRLSDGARIKVSGDAAGRK